MFNVKLNIKSNQTFAVNTSNYAESADLQILANTNL